MLAIPRQMCGLLLVGKELIDTTIHQRIAQASRYPTRPIDVFSFRCGQRHHMSERRFGVTFGNDCGQLFTKAGPHSLSLFTLKIGGSQEFTPFRWAV